METDPNYIPGDRMYREHILDHYKNPRHYGKLKGADVSAEGNNPLCGDKLKVQLKVEQGKLHIGFKAQGCAISVAAGSMLTEAVEGKTVEEAKKLTKEDMLELLSIPIGAVRMKCALLAWDTLRLAIGQYESK